MAANEQVSLIARAHGSADDGDAEVTEAGMKLRIECERLARRLGLRDDVG